MVIICILPDPLYVDFSIHPTRKKPQRDFIFGSSEQKCHAEAHVLLIAPATETGKDYEISFIEQYAYLPLNSRWLLGKSRVAD